MTNNEDELAEMLGDGWVVVGYQFVPSGAGIMSDQIMLQKGNELRVFSVFFAGGKETARAVRVLSPKPPKKGFFG